MTAAVSAAAMREIGARRIDFRQCATGLSIR
jgi:hypothetical protein